MDPLLAPLFVDEPGVPPCDADAGRHEREGVLTLIKVFAGSPPTVVLSPGEVHPERGRRLPRESVKAPPASFLFGGLGRFFSVEQIGICLAAASLLNLLVQCGH